MLETVLVMKKGKKNQKTSLLLKLKKIIQMIAHQKSSRLSLSRCGTKTQGQTRADIPMSIRDSTGVTSTFWGATTISATTIPQLQQQLLLSD